MSAMPKVMLLSFAIALGACTSSGGVSAPRLSVNETEINMCVKTAGVPYVWRNFQMTNTGDSDLLVANVEVRGDSSCAFECLREPLPGEPADAPVPCPQEEEDKPAFALVLTPGATTFLTVAYTPSEVGSTDQAALVITSNSAEGLTGDAKLGVLVVPMCGQGGAAPSDAGVDGGADGGADAGADGGTTGTGGGEAECPVCEAPASGAAWCEDGYSPLP
jgi:hypothetical protein